MRLLGKLLICIMLMFVSLTFFACELPTLPSLSCSGVITFVGEGLEGVTIKSDVKDYTKTNNKGEYSFTTNAKKIKIIPEKEGYMFSPKFVELEAGTNTASFVATEIQNINGTISLSKIIITPTSILNSPDNYVFINDGNECLKSKDITIYCNGQQIVFNTNNNYLEKNKQNEILITQNNVTFVCGEDLKLGVLINAYFIIFHQEAYTTDTDFAYLEITKQQTNADLENGNIIYTLYGINNKARTFTFDISFVFEYEEKI